MMMEYKKIHVSRVFTETGWLENGEIIIDNNGKIHAIKTSDKPCSNELIAMPTLIDTHIHGAMGADVMDATHEGLNTISLFLAKHGIGAFLATTVTDSNPHTELAIKQIKSSYRQGLDGAMLLGGYLEGPFFTSKNRGAHPEKLLQSPDLSLIQKWLELGEGSIKCIALAPESPQALEIITWLKQQGIRVMLGHSNANYDLAKQALLVGADGVVHCYNGMSGLHHREPGMVGAALTTPNCQVELIVDGHHVHAAAVNVAFKCCAERVLLISDSMRAAGMPDGDYQLGEMLVHMHDGVVKTDLGGLAGSTLTIDNAVKNVVKMTDISFEQAWLNASYYPAKALKIEHELGSLAAEKIANIALLNPQHDLMATLVKGKMAFISSLLPDNLFI